jgi:prepilin peptidase CpaA
MEWQELLLNHWHVKLVTVVLIVAAYIDGKQLRVPNWITFPMVLSGLAFNALWFGAGWGAWDRGLIGALLGTIVGLGTLIWLWMLGGMGAGDVKLMAGIGAWLGPIVTLHVFVATVFIGAVMAVAMVWSRDDWKRHTTNFLVIIHEWLDIRKLGVSGVAEIAAERKPTMRLLPYGIPICFGAVASFLYDGLLF